MTVGGDFEDGGWPLDFGPLRLRGVDRQIGLTARLAAACDDPHIPSNITHPLCDLIAYRLDQIACA